MFLSSFLRRFVITSILLFGVPSVPYATEKETQLSSLIDARCEDNDTGIYVTAGAKYRVDIHSIEEPIVDGDGFWMKKLKGLEGWDTPLAWPLAFKKKRAFERYFALIGSVDHQSPMRIRGYDPRFPTRSLFSPKESGRLYCYFNDWPSRYDNNHGKLRITLTRVASE